MPRERYGAPFCMIITDRENGTWLQRYPGKQVLPGSIVHP